jgi:release factor glutamine methyltransferase
VTVAAALRRAADELAAGGVETAQVDAELIVGHVLGLTRSALVRERERRFTGEELAALDALVARRAQREPLAYVLGEWGFRRLTLRTDRRALVPRPETEVVVERCLALLAPVPRPLVLDVGTGCGAIALALADEHPGASVTALDASPAALALARENVDLTGLADRVELVEGDLGRSLPGGPYDLVVANPPYVPAAEVEALASEVRDWEPREAILDAGQTEAVLAAAPAALRPAGWLVLETHWDAAPRVGAQLEAAGFEAVTITRDLAGRERVVEGRRA